MKYTAYYVVRPKDTIEELLGAATEEFPDLMEPVLWTHEEGGRTVYGPRNYERAIKLTFVASAKQQISQSSPAAANRLKLTEECFDRWWTLEAFHGADEAFEEVLAELLDSSSKDELATTDEPYLTALIAPAT